MIRLCAFADEAATDLDGQIAALKRERIPCVELRSVDGKNVADISEEEAQGYAARLREAGIEVWSIGSPLGKAEIDIGTGDVLWLALKGDSAVHGLKTPQAQRVDLISQ